MTQNYEQFVKKYTTTNFSKVIKIREILMTVPPPLLQSAVE